MTDKEKLIEEMAKDMGIAFQLLGTTRFGPVAEVLVNAGYRKIPEGSVVLTREEYDDMQRTIRDYMTRIGEFKVIEIPKERKETAEKIYKKYLCDILSLEAKEEFAKQFGVEVEE